MIFSRRSGQRVGTFISLIVTCPHIGLMPANAWQVIAQRGGKDKLVVQQTWHQMDTL